jgi:hypothetical protein
MKKQFYYNLGVAFAVLCLAYIGIRQWSPMRLPTVIFGAIVGYALLSMLLFNYLDASLKANPRRFATAIMGTTAIKMFATMAFLGIYLYIDRSQKLMVALGVFAIYIIYTVALLMPFMKPIKK